MKIIVLGSLAALALAGAAPALAQPAPYPAQSQYGQYERNGAWDRDAFWRGASADPRQRIDFLQQRIDRGIADRTLDRREAQQAQRDLDRIRRDARQMGRLDRRESAMLISRLDNLGQQLRWQGQGRAYAVADRRFDTQYDASRYYRSDARYKERRLSAQDEVYRGSDGRYYCKRNDGTTGLIVGAIGGAALGNVIDGGHERAAGTLLGGVLGALVGKSIDEKNSDVRCR